MKRLTGRLRSLLEQWRYAHLEATSVRTGPWSLAETTKIFYIFGVVAISLILQEYFGGPDTFSQIASFIDNPASPEQNPVLWFLVGWLKPDGESFILSLDRNGYWELCNLVYWASWRVLGFGAIPVVAVLVYPGMRLRDSGLGVKGLLSHLWIYGVLFVPVLIAVIIVSYSEEFSSYYPFYSESTRSRFDFLIWEAFYVAQFLSLEFFFRGFMIQPLRKILGYGAIPAMMIPYVMIHFGKPLPECFAAIIAGFVLGLLAMLTRSIWGGFIIHVGVAISMDVAANLQKFGLPWLESLF